MIYDENCFVQKSNLFIILFSYFVTVGLALKWQSLFSLLVLKHRTLSSYEYFCCFILLHFTGFWFITFLFIFYFFIFIHFLGNKKLQTTSLNVSNVIVSIQVKREKYAKIQYAFNWNRNEKKSFFFLSMKLRCVFIFIYSNSFLFMLLLYYFRFFFSCSINRIAFLWIIILCAHEISSICSSIILLFSALFPSQ